MYGTEQVPTETGRGSPETGVTGGLNYLMWVLGSELWFSGSALN